MRLKFILVLLMVGLLSACGGVRETVNTDLPEPSTTALSTATASLQEAQMRSGGAGDAVESESAAEPGPAVTGIAAGGVQGQNEAPVPQQPIATPADMTFDDPGTNPFFDTADDNLSTFAMDVDTASFTVARNYLMNYSQLPPADAIRPEEFINYFAADYPSPEGDASFAITMEAAPAPFGYENHYLLRVGIQGRYVAPEDRDPVMLTFVIDVSGSMDMENRLVLVKDTLALLLDELREDDRVAIVVYSDQSRVVLNPTPASEQETIRAAIDALHPEGSTNVEDGLRLAYTLAEANLREGENNRVIVLSDGVANVGNTGPDSILNTIREGVDAGITLSTIGFGMGNYNDTLMEQLANDGNGNYYYVDNLREARRVFVHNLTSTLQVIGYDAKVQVEFNADVTDRYRLIGYENRAIADQDFRNDTVDAGEVGAGHSVTALYEIALEDGEDISGVVATAYIRYEDAETREVVEINEEITTDDLLASIDDASATFKLHAAVAEFAELLRGSLWAEGGTYGAVMALLNDAQDGLSDSEQLNELAAMIEKAVSLGDQ